MLSRPSVHSWPRSTLGDGVGRGKQRNEFRIAMHERVARAHGQHENQARPQDVGAQPAHHGGNLVAEQGEQRCAQAPRAVMQGGVRAGVRGLEVLACAGVGQEPAGARQVMRQQPVVIRHAGGVRGILGRALRETTGARLEPRATGRARCSRLRLKGLLAPVVHARRRPAQQRLELRAQAGVSVVRRCPAARRRAPKRASAALASCARASTLRVGQRSSSSATISTPAASRRGSAPCPASVGGGRASARSYTSSVPAAMSPMRRCLARHDGRGESHAVEHRQAVEQAKDVAGQERPGRGHAAVARHDAHARHALAGRAAAHQRFE